jgi:broad specificity phosphatase PhoE
MKNRIYIRHDRKEYLDGKGFPAHDPGLLDPSDYSNVSVLVDELVNEFGFPTCIFSSPYRRTRETCELILDELYYSYDCQPYLVIEPELSEYLGYRGQKNEEKEVDEETDQYNPPGTNESIEDLNLRLISHNNTYKNVSEVMWFVTHGKIINQLLKLNSIPKKGNIKCLEYFPIK